MGNLGIRITWLGHSTFLLKTPEGKSILVDPWLAGNPKCPEASHQVASDAILITHGHFDHVGDAVGAAARCAGSVVCIYEMTAWLKAEGVEESKLLGMNKGGSVTLDDVAITATMTDAKHSSSAIGADGSIVYLGEPAGYVVRFSNDFTLYISGDTSLFGDMRWVGTLNQPDAAILPIGDLYTMDPRAAAHACTLLGDRLRTVIPCHYGTFPPLTGTPEALRTHLAELGVDVEVVAAEPGTEVAIG